MPPPQAFGPIYEVIYHLLLGHKVLIFGSFVFLIILEGVILQWIVSQYNLIARDNFLVVFIWLILVFSNPVLTSLNPVLIAITLSSWALLKLFAIGDAENPLPKLFSVGFLISFSSLIYGSIFYYLVFLIISLFVLSLVNLRQIFVSLISFALPYLYLWAYGFMMNENIDFISKVNFSIDSMYFASSGNYFWTSIAITFIIAFLSIIGLVKLFSTLFSKLIQFRNNVTVLYVMFIMGIITQLLSGPWWYVHPFVIFVPLAILLSIFLSELKRTIYYDLTLIMIIALEFFQIYFLGNA